MVKILFVCLGNICRSPAAEGVLRSIASKDFKDLNLHVESCGMGNWHVGQLPDERMRAASNKRGVPLVSRAQQFHPDFFDSFDYILVADTEVQNELYRYAKTADQKSKIKLITCYSEHYPNQDIPDPYYQGELGFEQVLDMIEDSCKGLLEHLSKARS